MSSIDCRTIISYHVNVITPDTDDATAKALLGATTTAERRLALMVRERDGPDLDAAATRENIGALREAQGRFEDARDVRLRGAEKGHMLCSNEHVSAKIISRKY
ncbi:hypothetical protein FHL15_009535 [Xylaria flabelliformis]|uniref:Uncharacterized protein n=1 Tax=Xylaria flabelliformis TaxID=2512241 RepID=A0A553HNV5_9PEZI|nr:hypothetical protein FHL15_009535 [Xylaria flabelliformis]